MPVDLVILCLITLDLRVATYSRRWLQLRTMWVRSFLHSRLRSEFSEKRTQFVLEEIPQDRNVCFADGCETSRNCENRMDWVRLLLAALVAMTTALFLAH